MRSNYSRLPLLIGTFSSPKYCSCFIKSSQRHLVRSSESHLHMTDPGQECSPKTWEDVKNQKNLLAQMIPALTPTSYKGSSGRIGILGGSERYTGAPYYAAMSALRTGVDLVYVFCAEEAAIPIKTYSPELMVQSVYCARDFNQIKMNDNKLPQSNLEDMEEKLVHNMAQQVIMMLDRMHCLIIGPGLGRCPLVFKATSRIIEEAIDRDISLILDADVLYMLSLNEYKHLIQRFTVRPWANTILSPNVVEYKRLVETIGSGSEQEMRSFMKNIILVRKGEHDLIESFTGLTHDMMICQEKGGMKRCGGLGDVLSGVLGAFGAWYNILQKKKTTNVSIPSTLNNIVYSSWLACCITKRSTNKAFILKKRSMTAPDVLEMICEVMNDVDAAAMN